MNGFVTLIYYAYGDMLLYAVANGCMLALMAHWQRMPVAKHILAT